MKQINVYNTYSKGETVGGNHAKVAYMPPQKPFVKVLGINVALPVGGRLEDCELIGDTDIIAERLGAKAHHLGPSHMTYFGRLEGRDHVIKLHLRDDLFVV